MNSKDRVYASGRLPIHFSNVRFTCEFLLCFCLTWEFQVWKYFTVDLTKSRLKNKICIQFKPDPQLIHSWVTCENMRLFCTGGGGGGGGGKYELIITTSQFGYRGLLHYLKLSRYWIFWYDVSLFCRDICSRNYHTVTELHFQPYKENNGNEPLPGNVHQVGSGFIRQKPITYPTEREVSKGYTWYMYHDIW